MTSHFNFSCKRTNGTKKDNGGNGLVLWCINGDHKFDEAPFGKGTTGCIMVFILPVVSRKYIAQVSGKIKAEFERMVSPRSVSLFSPVLLSNTWESQEEKSTSTDKCLLSEI